MYLSTLLTPPKMTIIAHFIPLSIRIPFLSTNSNLETINIHTKYSISIFYLNKNTINH